MFWILQANIMLEYSLDEAEALLQKNLSQAKLALDAVSNGNPITILVNMCVNAYISKLVLQRLLNSSDHPV